MVAVGKERELKDKARFYGKTHPDMSLWQIATEQGIGDRNFKYNKHQSMTMGEDMLTRTLLKMTATLRVVYFCSVEFQTQ